MTYKDSQMKYILIPFIIFSFFLLIIQTNEIEY